MKDERMKNFYQCKVYATDEEMEDAMPFFVKLLIVLVVLLVVGSIIK